jgi:AAA family ATP:ADP antiporter
MASIAMSQSKNTIEKFLSVFCEVRAGEAYSTLMLCLSIFLLLTAYYIIKPVREALILAGSGSAEIKSYAAAGQAILLMIAVPIYGTLASRFPRRHLINLVTFFFTLCLGVFYIAAMSKVSIGVIFYLWVGIFNLMLPAQFWAFANDSYTPEDGKRLFVIIAFGASAGAVFGSFITSQLIKPLGVYQLLIVSSGLLLLSLLLINLVDTREKENIHETTDKIKSFETPLEKSNPFALVFKHKYLLLIALLMLFLNWINTTGEYILSGTVKKAAIVAINAGKADGMSEGQYIGNFYGNFYGIVNVAALLCQLFLVSRILKYMGICLALLILPFIALGGYFIIAFFPILSIVRWAKTTENATDYSLQNTLRQVLFLPTTREHKYKAKQAIDTFFVRMGDVFSAILVYVGTTWLSFHTQHFALFNMAMVIVWIFLAFHIGKENRRLISESGRNIGSE